ncbi:DEAD/DEAH box helicase domain protein [Candidatus Ruthia magnifica str. Cm (Calyptogena magnifica)]|uniref:DEAD-box ATP-dependent RNA helicase RhpA n=1 Tax=Ruthia magnifica subsp. Calyptogena magnifica TaxID=413404 RepID=A1AVG5_RUTMC|nr:DEAD/DEAH box helicase [Candidatus Ruthturnera calyptogenae]ABL01922.1 DEAD/DEAH box helicase domain protein [Candidatus Ruthia magnifica str. Cm (Calyptogena magnifica)]
MDFSKLGLSDSILKAIEQQGYREPSLIQAQAIPAILEGKDVMAAAQTGTGKTAGFILPILEILSKCSPIKFNQVRMLILTPTRELAAQVSDSVTIYGKYLSFKSSVVFGGVKINPQMRKLRDGVDILVATPGRLLDLYSKNAVKFDTLEIIVFDEADRMLDMGFIHDIKRILKILPQKKQTLMFSATFSNDIRILAKSLVNNPVEISVTPRNSTVKTVKQWIHPVDKFKKQALLIYLIQEHSWYQVLVFSRTKHGANRIATQLEKKKISATVIHGNKSQGARTRALADFKNAKVNVLVATDIAARGIDIDQLPHVVNFDLPRVPEDYVHRIGRTGRAGSKGEAISLVSVDEAKQLFDIERLIQNKLDRIMVEGFVPEYNLPESGKKILSPKTKKNKNYNKLKYGKNRNSKKNKLNNKKGFLDSKFNKKSTRKII